MFRLSHSSTSLPLKNINGVLRISETDVIYFYRSTVHFEDSLIITACCHTLHTIYVHILQIVLPVILARKMSAP
jgi:hypothetical protein